MAKSKKEVEAIISGAGVFQSLITLLVDKVKELGGTMEDIYRLITPAGAQTLKRIAEVIVNCKPYFRSVSGDHELIIDATDGTEGFIGAHDVFDGNIDPDFRNWGADEPGKPTLATKVEVLELERDGTFPQMFGSLSHDLDRLCLTPAQIRGFARKYRDWFRLDGRATFFLYWSHGHLFVAFAYLSVSGKLRASVSRFERGYARDAELSNRVVVPKLT